MSTHLQDRRTPDPDLPEDPKPPKEGLSITQVIGGALAAMTAAALGSRLSVAGTVVGAALASIVAAVAGSVYTSSLKRTSRQVSRVLTARQPGKPRPAAVASPSPRPARPPRISLKAVLAGSLAAFAVAALTLTGLELLTGRALSGENGTTISQVREVGTTSQQEPTPTPTPRGSSTPSASPSATPSAESSTSTTPVPEPVPSTTAAPTSSATPTPSSSASPLPSAVPSGPLGGE